MQMFTLNFRLFLIACLILKNKLTSIIWPTIEQFAKPYLFPNYTTILT